MMHAYQSIFTCASINNIMHNIFKRIISHIFCKGLKKRLLLARLGMEGHTIDHASDMFLGWLP